MLKIYGIDFSTIKMSKRFFKNSEKNALSFIIKQEKIIKKVYPFVKKLLQNNQADVHRNGREFLQIKYFNGNSF